MTSFRQDEQLIDYENLELDENIQDLNPNMLGQPESTR
jgi:hypothetical protein